MTFTTLLFVWDKSTPQTHNPFRKLNDPWKLLKDFIQIHLCGMLINISHSND